MATTWSLKRYHIVLLAFGLFALLWGIHPTSRELSRAYIDKLKAHWGWNQDGSYEGTDPEPGEEEEEEEIPLTEAVMGFFTADIPYRLPKFKTSALKKKRPRYYKGPGHPAFALFYATRNATNENPYFIASQQIVYRLLWDPHIKSLRYPVVVFVAPFIAQEQRDYFAAAGAIVREIGLLDFEAMGMDHRLDHRYRDVMSKLLMWNQTDFSRLAFVDSDAFPWTNIDNIFDEEISPRRECKRELLDPEEELITAVSESDPCHYVFAGLTERPPGKSINAGVLIFKPDKTVCEMLLQHAKHQDEYDNSYPEQGPITIFYRPDGPYPSTKLSEGWNGGADRTRDPDKDCYIVHNKIWASFFSGENWVQEDFNATWETMLDVYESGRFNWLRNRDDEQVDEVPVNEKIPVVPSEDEEQESEDGEQESETEEQESETEEQESEDGKQESEDNGQGSEEQRDEAEGRKKRRRRTWI